MKRWNYFLTLTIVSVLALGNLSALSAQESKVEEFTLEEITVTAQKRTENQQKVAIAMDVISGDELKEMGKTNIDEILSNVSSAIINKAADGLRVSLRGLANDNGLSPTSQPVAAPTVAINIDGAYNSRNDSGQGLYDVERVEVLFGPQSTMYASNSPGGIVNVVTAAPKVDKYEVSGTLEYGSYNLIHTEGAMNAPINSKMAMRAAFSTSVHDGYISNGGEDEDNKSARLKLLFQPTDKLSFVLTGSYSLTGGHGFTTVVPFANQDDVADPWTSNANLGDPSNMKQKAINANISWDTGIGALSIVPTYSKNNSNQSRTMTQPGSDTESTTNTTSINTQKGVEARMTSPSNFFFKWILGVNYFKSEDIRSDIYVGSTQTAEGTVLDKTHAFFGNITYPVTETFRATAGYRRSWDTSTNHTVERNKPDPNGTRALVESTTGQSYSAPDYKLGVEYDLASNSMLYADWSSSYRMQSNMIMQNAEGTVPPAEKLKAYTVGSKNRFFNNKVQVNASAFLYKYTGKMANQMKATSFYEDDPIFIGAGYTATDGTSGLDINGDGTITHVQSQLHDMNSQGFGDFDSKGIDLSVNWIISTQDKLNFSVSYLNAKWTKLHFHYQYPVAYPDEDFSGQENTYSPDFTVNFSYEHNFNLPNGGTLTPRFDTRYKTSYVLTWTKTDAPYNQQEAFHLSNLSVLYTSPDGKWTLNGYVKNLENYAEKTSLFNMGSASLMIGDPRTYGAVLSVKF